MDQEAIVGSATEWAAYIGAAAWLAPAITWLRARYEKPVVVPIIGSQTQLGYDSFGPSLTLSFAVTSKNRDAIINNICINLTHEQGKQIPLEWKVSFENPFNIFGQGMPTMNFMKNQPVTAIKAPHQSIAEQRIYFQNNYSLEKIKELKKPLEKVIRRYIDQSGSVSFDIHKDSSFSDIKEYIDNAFPWEFGKYQGEIIINTIESNTPFKAKFEFELTTNDIVILLKNKNEAKRQEEDYAILKDTTNTQYNFIFVFPTIKLLPPQ